MAPQGNISTRTTTACRVAAAHLGVPGNNGGMTPCNASNSVGGIAAENRLSGSLPASDASARAMTACGKLLKLTNPAEWPLGDRDRDRPRAAMPGRAEGRPIRLDASVPVAHCLFGTTRADGLGWKDGKTVRRDGS